MPNRTKTVLKALVWGSVALSGVVGIAAAGGSGAPLSSPDGLRALKMGEVCIDENYAVTSATNLPASFLSSYSGMMPGLADLHRDELYFEPLRCKVFTHIQFTVSGQAPRFVYTVSLRLVRDPQNRRAPGVVWQREARGVSDSVGGLENLSDAVDRLYVALIKDWRRTHP